MHWPSRSASSESTSSRMRAHTCPGGGRAGAEVGVSSSVHDRAEGCGWGAG